MSYYIIEYTSKDSQQWGTFHIPRSRTRRFLERVMELRTLGFTVKTQLID
jgi:hypothetical protein